MMHEPIQAKGPTMSEQLMEQYRLRGQRKCRNACIAAIVTVVLVLAVAGGVWWTAGDGSERCVEETAYISPAYALTPSKEGRTVIPMGR